MYLILTLGIVAFLFTLATTAVVRDLSLRFGLVDHPDGGRKRHTSPVPRVGGIAIAVSYCLAFGTVLLLPFTHAAFVQAALPAANRVLPAAGLIFLTGLLDDLLCLKPWQKLMGQVIAAGLACYAGVRVDGIAGHSMDLWLSVPITIVWLVGTTNAFNLIDGLDGLAAGVGLFATLTIVVAAMVNNNLPLAIVTVPLAGCLLGFLRYNFNPASIFLGDCGSLLIGFILGCCGALWSQKSATLLGLTAPLMALSIPLLDVGLSIVRRFIRHQPIFGADRGHIHHRLLDRGFSPRVVALLIYGACGIAASLSFLQSAVHNHFGGLIILLFCAGAWVGVQHLGYVEFAMARNLFLGGAFRKVIDAQTNLKLLQNKIEEAGSLEECWKLVSDSARAFGFTSLSMEVAGTVFQSGEAVKNAPMEIRVALSSGGEIRLNAPAVPEVNPLLIGPFVATVSNCIGARIDELVCGSAAYPAVTPVGISPDNTAPNTAL